MEIERIAVLSPQTMGYSMSPLFDFLGDMPPSAITQAVVDEYVAWRGIPRASRGGISKRTGRPHNVRERSAGPATCRRELGVLVAAINHAHEHGILRETARSRCRPRRR